jgi:plasmid replication initiation protein
MLNSNIKQYLIDLSRNFTKYELYNILALKSKYSIRLYELFKSYAFQRVKEIELEELKELLGAVNYEYRDFKRRIMDKTCEEINYYTDINVSYEAITKGRKVVAIVFYIAPKERLEGYAAYWNTIEEINKRNSIPKGQMSIYDLAKEER